MDGGRQEDVADDPVPAERSRLNWSLDAITTSTSANRHPAIRHRSTLSKHTDTVAAVHELTLADSSCIHRSNLTPRLVKFPPRCPLNTRKPERGVTPPTRIRLSIPRRRPITIRMRKQQ